MFITVLYGDCESLLCNPCCRVVNLLDNIRDRCGYREMKTELDLTDETGLVLELTDHKSDDALKYLTVKGEYILVEKKITTVESKDPSETSPQQEITYIPLVNGVNEKYPEYATRVAQRSNEAPKPGKQKKGKRRGKNDQ